MKSVASIIENIKLAHAELNDRLKSVLSDMADDLELCLALAHKLGSTVNYTQVSLRNRANMDLDLDHLKKDMGSRYKEGTVTVFLVIFGPARGYRERLTIPVPALINDREFQKWRTARIDERKKHFVAEAASQMYNIDQAKKALRRSPKWAVMASVAEHPVYKSIAEDVTGLKILKLPAPKKK